MGLKRIIHRASEEIEASWEIAKAISLKGAIDVFRAKIDIQIMVRNGFKEPENVKNRLLRKHAVVMQFLEKKFQSFWENYQVPAMPDCDEKYRNTIWLCWWQGLDNAPEIVKACVSSIKRNRGGV